MTMFPCGRPSAWLPLALITICLVYSGACLAKSTGVDENSALQSGPCYQALVDRNVSQPTTAPNRELGSACQAENGDVERAWARVVRLWGSDSADVPDYDNYVRADGGSPSNQVWKGLGLLGMLLVYAVCGTPLRSAASLMTAGSGVALRNAAETIADLISRGLLGLVLLWLLGFSYFTLVGGVAFVVVVARTVRASAATATPWKREDATNEANGLAILAAGAINDVLGAAPGLLGLALLSQHDARWLGVAVALAIVASAPPVMLARRRLRAHPLAMTIAGAVLAAGIGAFAQLDPPVAALIGRAGVLGLVIPLVFALMVVASGWRSLSLARASLKSEAQTHS